MARVFETKKQSKYALDIQWSLNGWKNNVQTQ